MQIGSTTGWRVLAIDDDPLFLEVVQVCLERAGCTVETACDPRDGLNRAIEGTYDLILLDLMMPGMAGEEILGLLKPLSLHQRIVVVSGNDEHEARQRSRDLGAAGYIQKPVDTRQFTTLLYDMLQERISDHAAEQPQPGSVTAMERVVAFVFGECEPTTSRKYGAVAILGGLLGVMGFLVAL
jgi:DNA-binding response OmpR family regulator